MGMGGKQGGMDTQSKTGKEVVGVNFELQSGSFINYIISIFKVQYMFLLEQRIKNIEPSF